MFPTEIIKKKRNLFELSAGEIQYFINSYTKGYIPDYQMSALLMAILLNGMNERETLDLTRTMLESGERVNFSDDLLPVDKHSTGGVGDKTSLILAPIVAACGVPVPMMSGRGLGHTGGTLDKLESIPGFRTDWDLEAFKKMVSDLGLCFIGQTHNICPADKKIYALRDVTATVESLPLICASIMSKKIAEGIRGLVLDVKVGSGAFMKTVDEAEALAHGLVSIGKGYGIETQALITDMSQPLGLFVGNSLEVGECLSILKRQDFLKHSYKDFSDTESLSLELSAHMVSIGQKISLVEARQKCLEVLDNGKAFEYFEKICVAQGGDLSKLPISQNTVEVFAKESGFISEYNTEKIGLASIALGAGRKQLTDVIQPECGIKVHQKLGASVEKGSPLFTLFTNGSGVDESKALLSQAFKLSSEAVETEKLILLKL